MATHFARGILTEGHLVSARLLLHVISKQEISPRIAEHVSWLPEVYSLN